MAVVSRLDYRFDDFYPDNPDAAVFIIIGPLGPFGRCRENSIRYYCRRLGIPRTLGPGRRSHYAGTVARFVKRRYVINSELETGPGPGCRTADAVTRVCVSMYARQLFSTTTTPVYTGQFPHRRVSASVLLRTDRFWSGGDIIVYYCRYCYRGRVPFVRWSVWRTCRSTRSPDVPNSVRARQIRPSARRRASSCSCPAYYIIII